MARLMMILIIKSITTWISISTFSSLSWEQEYLQETSTWTLIQCGTLSNFLVFFWLVCIVDYYLGGLGGLVTHLSWRFWLSSKSIEALVGPGGGAQQGHKCHCCTHWQDCHRDHTLVLLLSRFKLERKCHRWNPKKRGSNTADAAWNVLGRSH